MVAAPQSFLVSQDVSIQATKQRPTGDDRTNLDHGLTILCQAPLDISIFLSLPNVRQTSHFPSYSTTNWTSDPELAIRSSHFETNFY